jgi:hypothetical protein
VDDALHEALDDGCLPDVRLTDEDRVVLIGAREDANDDRVELPCLLDEVATVGLERMEVGVLGCGLNTAALATAEPLELGAHPRCAHASLLEAIGDLQVLEKAEQQLVDGEVRVATAVSPGSCISCVVIHFTVMMSRRLFPHMPSPLPPPKPSTADAAAELPLVLGCGELLFLQGAATLRSR